MSISELYDSEFKSRNRGHFSAIVRVASADGMISDQEKAFLDKLAFRLEISKEEYADILADPLKYPINPPYSYEQRLERLYDLGRMVHIDHHLGDKQLVLLRKLALALGFRSENVDYIIDKAMKLIDEKADLDGFVLEMEQMNR